MSYQNYLQQIQQLMAWGLFIPPINYSIMPCLPLTVPIQNQQAISQPSPPNETDDSPVEDDTDERSLFCANLDQNVTEELFYELFLQAGPIQKVYIPKDNNGKRRTFGFVTYKYRCTPFYALQLYQGVVLFGKRLDIKFQGKGNVLI